MAAERPGVESGTRVLGSLGHKKSIFQFPIQVFALGCKSRSWGLGTMGWHCASHLVTVSSSPLRVWNRTESLATRHALQACSDSFGSTTPVDLRSALRLEAEVTFTCLPDSDVVSTSTSSLPNWSPSYCDGRVYDKGRQFHLRLVRFGRPGFKMGKVRCMLFKGGAQTRLCGRFGTR